jgi:ribonuclease VapC
MTQLPLFDTSALLAFIYEEPGSDNVELHLSDGGMISAVNWSELGQKILHHNLGWANISQQLKAVGLIVQPVIEEDAEGAALLWEAGDGLSIADRLCLSMGQRLGVPIITADKAWAKFAGVTVIR